MPVFRLNRDDVLFPPVDLAAPNGLLAVGGHLTPARLLAAYSHGIFPWGKFGRQYAWFSPDPRLVLLPDGLHVSHSMRRILRHSPFTVTVDTAFRRVMEFCSTSPGRGDGTWINPEMIDAYTALHEAGYGHSVEVWSEDGSMAGGLYGVARGRCFFGESMFSLVPNASKLALICLVNLLRGWEFDIIDCQQVTGHMMRLGARPIRRPEFMRRIAVSQQHETRCGKWSGSAGDSLLLERKRSWRPVGKQGST